MSIKLLSLVWELPEPENLVLRMVLLTLADVANNEGICWPSIRYISRRSKVNERTVQKAVRKLVSMGFIDIQTGGRNAVGGQPRANVYRLKFAAPAESGAGTPSRVAYEAAKGGPGTSSRVAYKAAEGGLGTPQPSYEPSEKPREEPPAPVLSPEVSVEDIYLAYPRHVAKADALTAIQRAIKNGAAPAHLLARTAAYAQAVARWPNRFPVKDGIDTCPHPATWFNGARYDDDPREWIRKTPGDGAPAVDLTQPWAHTGGVEVVR